MKLKDLLSEARWKAGQTITIIDKGGEKPWPELTGTVETASPLVLMVTKSSHPKIWQVGEKHVTFGRNVKSVKIHESKNMVNEASQQWQVKDAIVIQKAHERVLKAASSLDKAVQRLAAVSKKHRNKPNAPLFEKEANAMYTAVQKDVLDPRSAFWKNWEAFKKTGKAIFDKHWN